MPAMVFETMNTKLRITILSVVLNVTSDYSYHDRKYLVHEKSPLLWGQSIFM